MNKSVFGKAMENIGKHWDIKLVTTEKRINYLVSEPSYATMIKKLICDIKIKENTTTTTKLKTNLCE